MTFEEWLEETGLDPVDALWILMLAESQKNKDSTEDD